MSADDSDSVAQIRASYAALGRSLLEQRNRRGASRDAISQATKISPALLEALEEGQLERLPDPVFLQNMIRKYAEAVGLDADQMVARWQQIPGVIQAPGPTPQTLEQARRVDAWKGVAVAVIAAILAVLALAHWANKI